jgi:hypothetical protein
MRGAFDTPSLKSARNVLGVEWMNADPGLEHKVLRRLLQALGNPRPVHVQNLDRHSAVGRNAVVEQFARSLRKPDQDLIAPRFGGDPLRKLGRQSVEDFKLAFQEGRCLGMAGPHRMPFLLLLKASELFESVLQSTDGLRFILWYALDGRTVRYE